MVHVLTTPSRYSFVDKVLEIFIVLSRSDVVVKRGVAILPVLKQMLGWVDRVSVPQCTKLLKAFKYLSTESSVLPALAAAGAISRCIAVLRREWELAQHVLAILYNLCRIDRRRQEEAARAGLIAGLLPFGAPESTHKQLALPILFDVAAISAARPDLWKHQLLPFFVELFSNAYFQGPALEAVAIWCADECTAVETVLMQDANLDALLQAVSSSHTQATLPSLLQGLGHLLGASTALTKALVTKRPLVLTRLLEKLRMVNLPTESRIQVLKLLKQLLDAAPTSAPVALAESLLPLTQDRAVLVQELASQLCAQLSSVAAHTKS
jgi:hypothetical protein